MRMFNKKREKEKTKFNIKTILKIAKTIIFAIKLRKMSRCDTKMRKKNFPNKNKSGNKGNWDKEKEKVETFSMRAFIREIQSTMCVLSGKHIHIYFFSFLKYDMLYNPRAEHSSNSFLVHGKNGTIFQPSANSI